MKWFLSALCLTWAAWMATSLADSPAATDIPTLAAAVLVAPSDQEFIESRQAFRAAVAQADPDTRARPRTWTALAELSRAFDRSRDRKTGAVISSAVKAEFLKAAVAEESAAVAGAWRDRLTQSVICGVGATAACGFLFFTFAVLDGRVKRRIARQVPAVGGRTWYGLLDALVRRADDLDRRLADLRHVQVDNRRLKFELSRKPNAVQKSTDEKVVIEHNNSDQVSRKDFLNESPPEELSPVGHIETINFETRQAPNGEFAALSLTAGSESKVITGRVTGRFSRVYVDEFFRNEEEPGQLFTDSADDKDQPLPTAVDASSNLPDEVRNLIANSSATVRIQCRESEMPTVLSTLSQMAVSDQLIASHENVIYWSLAAKNETLDADDGKSFIDWFRETWTQNKKPLPAIEIFQS
jgi:hypothetical protein